VVGLFLLAVLVALYVARPFLIPLVVAYLLKILLAPIVRAFGRLRLPPPAAAAVVVLALLVLTSGTIAVLWAPAVKWMGELPRTMERVEWKLRGIKQRAQELTAATEKVEDLTDLEERDRTPEVRVEEPGLLEAAMSRTREFAVGATVVLILLYFLLAVPSGFQRKLEHLIRNRDERERVQRIIEHIEIHVGIYLRISTVINIVLGIAVALALWAMEVPNPLLWGVMAAVLNFVPYLGAVVGTLIIAVVSLVTSEGLVDAAWPPLVYFVLTSAEGSVVKPLVLGHRLVLSPGVLFVSLAFWGWLWGIPGAFLAVPFTSMIKIVCDHVELLRPVAYLLEPRR
jgi:predicted PurR-regulated permease PerM